MADDAISIRIFSLLYIKTISSIKHPSLLSILLSLFSIALNISKVQINHYDSYLHLFGYD